MTMTKDRSLCFLSLVLMLRHSACIQEDENDVNTQEFESGEIVKLEKNKERTKSRFKRMRIQDVRLLLSRSALFCACQELDACVLTQIRT